MTDRYSTSHLPEDQYEPGSDNTVLRNKQGIIDSIAMGEAETNALWHAQNQLVAEITADHTFTAADICEDGDTLVGASLGGMVACEITKITKIRKISRLYLLGSAIRKEEISTLLAALHPLARVAPIDWLRFSASAVPVELAKMFAAVDSSFIRAMCAAIFNWEGLGQTTTQVVRIHGANDLLIPPPKAVDLLINGGHLVSMTHASECVEFIKETEKQASTLPFILSSHRQEDPVPSCSYFGFRTKLSLPLCSLS